MASENILIVEDNDKLAKLYRKVLQHAGYETLTVDTAAGAIEALADFDPAVVFLDWRLYDGTCEPFLVHLQSLPPESVPRIVVISAEVSDIEVEGYKDVVQQHFTKPISISDIVKYVSG